MLRRITAVLLAAVALSAAFAAPAAAVEIAPQAALTAGLEAFGIVI